MEGVSHVPSGYTLDRKHGLTAREREMLGCLAAGMSLADAGRDMGVSRQRALQLVRALEKKGVLVRDGETITITVAQG